MFNNANRIALFFLVLSVIGSLHVFFNVDPTWREQSQTYQIYENDLGQSAYTIRGREVLVESAVPYESSPLRQEALNNVREQPSLSQQWVYDNQDPTQLRLIKPVFHYGIWSLLPAFVAILLCLLTREPLVALFGGIVVGAFMLGRFDITDAVLIPNMATTSAAGILLLYLWLLGGLMGIWSKTGAAQAFATYMTEHFVKGPRSAKLITWMLGVLFFQGGTMSTVLVGSTVKPMADKAKVSHEELSYIVDSTASPIASVIAFNAWPAYVQALIFVPGVSFLATETDRIAFFFNSVPFSFYGILAVLGTLLISLNINTFAGKPLRKAIERARTTGQLDAPNAKPLSAKELQNTTTPENYNPSMLEFILPIILLIAVAITTFVVTGSPQINWAFGAALGLCIVMALSKGMQLGDLLDGFGTGIKGVVVASVILMLAITIGAISKQLGGGIYLVELLGQQIPFWLLPVILQAMTMVIAFSTGTSWGTYAIAFPLALPLAWAIAGTQGLGNPEIYMAICFATVLNGSVFGDQCSPISDTTILSSMTTGCDLLDHVKTQIVPASYAAGTAAVLWTISTLLLV
ncbi:sodium:proton antiporter [Alteromonadaceae bacterium M269]|nr:sodium:proton antiporter [Alteromonadaceae bacterium M269]